MSERLSVSLFGRPAGELIMDGELRSPEDWRFRYDTNYLLNNGVPLSVSLPMRTEPFEGAVVRNWFSNLLPEGAIREAITARLRLPARDDFALLAAIGGECAGAVSISNDQAGTVDDDFNDSDLPFTENTAVGEGEWAMLAGPHRLSLAGAQDKSAVVLLNDKVRLPRKGELSTHILKPDSHRLPGLRDLEALGLRLARAIALPVASAHLMHIAGQRVLLVERYDRQKSADGKIERLHQEDFCQALGYPGEHKYEAAGGPGLATCADLIRTRLRLGPPALRGFLDWVIFCVLIGNADAHAKNLALLRDSSGHLSLAPFYDLVPTIAFSQRLIDRAPALRMGSAKHITEIKRTDWVEFSRATGYAARFVIHRVTDIGHSIISALPKVVDQLVEDGADALRLRERFVPELESHTRKLLRVLED